jgi:hypothetical protein
MDGNNPEEEKNWLIKFFKRRLEIPPEDRKKIVADWKLYKSCGSGLVGLGTGYVIIKYLKVDDIDRAHRGKNCDHPQC